MSARDPRSIQILGIGYHWRSDFSPQRFAKQTMRLPAKQQTSGLQPSAFSLQPSV